MVSQIVLLNGTSSAGKTTVARALQASLEPGWLFLEFDLFVEMLTDQAPSSAEGPDEDELGDWLADAWYRAAGGLAGAGFDLLVEDVIWEPYRLDAALRHLAPFDVTFVAVRCPFEVVVQREMGRGDREMGLAARRFDLVHLDRAYDCEIDTSTMSPETCAAAIREVVEGRRGRAFDLMRSARET